MDCILGELVKKRGETVPGVAETTVTVPCSGVSSVAILASHLVGQGPGCSRCELMWLGGIIYDSICIAHHRSLREPSRTGLAMLSSVK